MRTEAESSFNTSRGAALLWAAALAGPIAWRSWGRSGREWTAHGDEIVGRSRFMALGGGLFSVFFFLIIVAQWVPIFFLRPCE